MTQVFLILMCLVSKLIITNFFLHVTMHYILKHSDIHRQFGWPKKKRTFGLHIAIEYYSTYQFLKGDDVL